MDTCLRYPRQPRCFPGPLHSVRIAETRLVRGRSEYYSREELLRLKRNAVYELWSCYSPDPLQVELPPNRSGIPEQIPFFSGNLGAPAIRNGPAVSFSYCHDSLWAGISFEHRLFGIDVAAGRDFEGDYPLLRVFSQEELGAALAVARESTEEAAAILWAVKEAVAKALGCGFHLVEPHQIQVRINSHLDEVTAHIHLKSDTAVFLDHAAELTVHCLPAGDRWLAIAVSRGISGPDHRGHHSGRPLG